jgi:hypothetical protein
MSSAGDTQLEGRDMQVQSAQQVSGVVRLAGVAAPETKLATEATELVRDVTTERRHFEKLVTVYVGG